MKSLHYLFIFLFLKRNERVDYHVDIRRIKKKNYYERRFNLEKRKHVNPNFPQRADETADGPSRRHYLSPYGFHVTAMPL